MFIIQDTIPIFAVITVDNKTIIVYPHLEHKFAIRLKIRSILQHGGESRDILNVYSNGTYTKFDLYFFKLILNEFSCGTMQIICHFCSKSLYKSHFPANGVFFHTSSSNV